MSGIKSPVEDALRAAIHDRLYSLVYSALNHALDCYHDPKELHAEWREIGAYGLAILVIQSALSDTRDWSTYPRMMMAPRVGEFLRVRTADDIVPIVSEWLEGEPLDPRISEDPGDEDWKVRKLKALLLKLNE